MYEFSQTVTEVREVADDLLEQGREHADEEYLEDAETKMDDLILELDQALEQAKQERRELLEEAEKIREGFEEDEEEEEEAA